MILTGTVTVDPGDVAASMDDHEDMAVFLNRLGGLLVDDEWLDDVAVNLSVNGQIFVERLASALAALKQRSGDR